MTRVLFNDGAGIDPDDHSLQRELFLKLLADQLAGNMAGPDMVPWDVGTSGRNDSGIRPLGNAGAINGSGASAINVNGGVFLGIDYGGTFGDDAPIALLAHARSLTNLTGFVAAASTMYRRDLIQGRVVSNDDSAANTDFESAVSRALSTSSLVLRSRVSVEFARKAGVEYASQALADTPSNEQTPDAGWFKIASVLCDDTGMLGTSNFWDWRKPWGYSRGLSTPQDFYSDGGISTGNGGQHVKGDASNLLLTDCPFKNLMGPTGIYYRPVRLERVFLSADFVSAPAASDVRLTQWDLHDGFVKHFADVGGVFGTTKQQALLLDDDGTYPPLWANGGTNPFALNERGFLRLTVTTAGGTSDLLYGARWEGWGGR